MKAFFGIIITTIAIIGTLIGHNPISIETQTKDDGLYTKTVDMDDIFHMSHLAYDDQTFASAAFEELADADTIQLIIETYKLRRWDNPYDEIEDIITRINAQLDYDLEMRGAHVNDVLEAGKGVCLHYAMIFYTIANCEGIPTELIAGELTDGDYTYGHAWCEVYIDGNSYAVDPTNYTDIIPNEALYRYAKCTNS